MLNLIETIEITSQKREENTLIKPKTNSLSIIRICTPFLYAIINYTIPLSVRK
jgi:hypothetical protein